MCVTGHFHKWHDSFMRFQRMCWRFSRTLTKDTKGINCSRLCSFLGYAHLDMFDFRSFCDTAVDTELAATDCNRLWPTPGDPPPHVTTSIFGICAPRNASLSLCVTLQSTLLTAMECIGDLPPNFGSSVRGTCTSWIVSFSFFFFLTQQTTLCWQRWTVSEICPLPAPLLFLGYAHLEIFDFFTFATQRSTPGWRR